MADWIWMQFGMEIAQWEGTILVVNVGHPIVTKGDFDTQLCESA